MRRRISGGRARKRDTGGDACTVGGGASIFENLVPIAVEEADGVPTGELILAMRCENIAIAEADV